MYIDFSEYSAVYSDLSEKDFAFLCFKACLELDKQTKGVDGYSKLDNAFPEDEKAAQAVKYCAIELVHLMHSFDNADNAIGYEETEEGKYIGKQITSVSSGSESISYSAGNNVSNSSADRRYLINSLVRQYLDGIVDKNGVNLLFMGAYPNVFRYDNNI